MKKKLHLFWIMSYVLMALIFFVDFIKYILGYFTPSKTSIGVYLFCIMCAFITYALMEYVKYIEEKKEELHNHS